MNIIFFPLKIKREKNKYISDIYILNRKNQLFKYFFDKIEQNLKYKVLIQNNYSVLLD